MRWRRGTSARNAPKARSPMRIISTTGSSARRSNGSANRRKSRRPSRSCACRPPRTSPANALPSTAAFCATDSERNKRIVRVGTPLLRCVMPRKPTRKTYRLRYRPPYDFPALLTFFGKRAIPSVERIEEKGYERDFALDGNVGRLRVEQGRGDALKLTVDFPDVTRHAEIASHVRRMFDTD